jgi:hypothetical protein
VRSFAHGALLGLGVGGSEILPGVHLTWALAVHFGLIMAGISVLTSLGSIVVPGADPETGSFLPVNPGVAIVSLFKRRK